MHIQVNGVKLFIEVEGTGLERFENCGHSVWRDEPQRAFEVLRAFIVG
jgi:pimeloyl-ACP methyl ester carboxylesterase